MSTADGTTRAAEPADPANESTEPTEPTTAAVPWPWIALGLTILFGLAIGTR
ncbi:hypothetical protein ACQP00_19675 [Dactylosporangium sp. CS-047395]|uniref:hypothetical protein n=1 Tax=Dactylosporangium sp. CS-047395 TaxID=3239936 RepID=UPI003D8E5ABB